MRAGNIIALAGVLDYTNAIAITFEDWMPVEVPKDIYEWYYNGIWTQSLSNVLRNGFKYHHIFEHENDYI